MSWIVVCAIVVALVLSVVIRRRDLRATESGLAERSVAKARGSHEARLQYPHVDLARCIGCGSCVAACPEDGVLAMVHGQALVVHGARCVGHGRCAVACPVGAIALTLGDLSTRKDIPALTESLESATQPGLFLAGEVTGYALVRTAIAHGTAVAEEVARRTRELPPREEGVHDLVIVGAGPAGLSCALQARVDDLDYLVLEQEELGGTVAKYPRRKLVMTQPVDLPGVGRLDRESYTKEELIDLWQSIVAELQLPVHTRQTFTGVDLGPDGVFTVRTNGGEWRARHVCLALGRRGTPNKLGVPGEDLPKVSYSLLDAHSYHDRRILVVGGGDSAIEAALGLAEQEGNQVSISYRREGFFRLKARNETRLMEALQEGRIQALLASQVVEIEPDHVVLRTGQDGREQLLRLENDEVFVLAGGTPPFQLLEQSGVSFDPSRRQRAEPLANSGGGLTRALGVALVFGLAILTWLVAQRGYYSLPAAQRVAHPSHGFLRPAGTLGLAFGIGAVALIAFNLLYLARRGELARLRFASLQRWMTSHVVTGILALLFALVHSAMAPGATVGGHALVALGVLVLTGAVGRYFYAFVPRAANGRELALEEVHGKLAALAGEWDRENRDFGERVRARVSSLVAAGHWRGSFTRRLVALVSSQRGLRETLAALEAEGRAEGVPASQLRELLALARKAHRSSLMAAHYEDLRALMASWRYLHRWVALYMVLIVALHVIAALRYATFGGAP